MVNAMLNLMRVFADIQYTGWPKIVATTELSINYIKTH